MKKSETEYENQWCVSSVDEFLPYFCPDCDIKKKPREDFVEHALSLHPLSANYLGTKLLLKKMGN